MNGVAMVDMDDILHRHDGREGALLPILHDVQAALGYIPEDVIRAIADHLNLSHADVSGVVSFYHDFRRTPDPRPAIKLCRAEACQARGSEALAAHAERVAGDRVRIETVYCLGLCSVGPNAMIGDQPHARLDGGKIAALIGNL
ncbi:MAG: NAD(P)H-dependent oxidoreductase subunit E [Sphingomonas sp.]|uniref:NAD(P)H-dependent oxidoreductase subunit E n=1 Tax=Sphingomonas sp. TaxID=28214 RepID=UPI003F7EA8B6